MTACFFLTMACVTHRLPKRGLHAPYNFSALVAHENSRFSHFQTEIGKRLELVEPKSLSGAERLAASVLNFFASP